MIATMSVTTAGFAFFLDVTDFAAGRHFAITAHDAAARESGEPEKSNQAHGFSILSTSTLSKPCTAAFIVIVVSPDS
jgi:hypothetical protein